MTVSTTHRLSALERRESIIGAATRLFAEKGFRGTTTRELALAVGVTEPVLYEHFQTKQQIYEAVLERISASALKEMESLMEQYADHQDNATILRGVARTMAESFRRHPEYVRLILLSALDGEEVSRTFYSELRARMVEAVSGLLRKRAGAGFDPQLAAHAFFCMVAHHGLQNLLFEQRSENTDEVSIADMVELFTRGIGK